MKSAFNNFAPAILKVYHRDKEAFWAAVMAPFLANNVSLLDWWKNLKVDLGLLSAFRGLDGEARQVLSDFSSPFGFDVAGWESNRSQYVGDIVAYDAKLGLAEIVVKNRFTIGDRLEIIHPSGNRIIHLERMLDIEGAAVNVAPGSGYRVRIPLDANLEKALVTRLFA